MSRALVFAIEWRRSSTKMLNTHTNNALYIAVLISVHISRVFTVLIPDISALRFCALTILRVSFHHAYLACNFASNFACDRVKADGRPLSWQRFLYGFYARLAWNPVKDIFACKICIVDWRPWTILSYT